MLSNQEGLFLCLFILLGAVLATCLHEFGHAIVAYWGGDKTVKEKGYLTLNPLKYTDVSTSLVLPIVFLIMGGFALPGGAVYINTHLLRGRGWKSAVSAAGPGMTALTALLLSIPFHLDFAIYSYGWFWPALAFLAQIEIAVLLLNLLPIPALDGYGILEPWLPENMQQQLRGVKKYGFLFLLAMFWTSPDFSRWFWEVSFAIAELLGVPSDLSAEGYRIFQSYRWFLLLLLIGLAIGNKFLSHNPLTGADVTAKEKQDCEKQREQNEKILFQNPGNYRAIMQQGWVLMGLGNYHQAQEHYSNALKRYPQDSEFRFSYGLVLACQRKLRAAIEEYDKVLEQEPENNNALFYKANALSEVGQSEEAIDILDHLLKHGHYNANTWYVRGLILERLGRQEEALQSYRDSVKPDDRQARCWAALARVQHKMSYSEDSQNTLRLGLAENPTSVPLWDVKLNWLLKANNYSGLLEECDRCDTAMGQQSAFSLNYQAIAFARLQRYSAATAAFEFALEKDPSAAWVQINRAECLINMKCTEAALEELSELLSEDPDNRSILEIKAHGLVESQEYDGAISLYQYLSSSAQLETEEKARLLSNIGFVLRRKGDYQAALEVQDQALKVLPNYEYALSNRGWTLTLLGQVEAGLAEMELAVNAKPDDPLLWKIKGIALQEQKQYQLALTSYEQSLKIKPDIEILCDQAICFLGLDDPDSATQVLQKAQDLHEPTALRTVAEKPELAAFFQENFAQSSND